jgi:hypothetical protein
LPAPFLRLLMDRHLRYRRPGSAIRLGNIGTIGKVIVLGGRRSVAQTFVLGLVSLLVIAPASAWASLALWYRVPGPESVRALAAILFIIIGLATIVSLVLRRRLKAQIVFVIAFGAVLTWFGAIKAPGNGDWALDVARQTTGVLDGDTLTLTNVRDFEWQSDSAFTEHWSARSYDLSKLRTLDLFLSYWAGPEMAHFILSFGFEGGDQIAWSIEVRRSKSGEFSPIADLFKSNPLVILASDERDVVRVRSNIRGEDVQLYRLRTPPEAARALLLEYVQDSNALAADPVFYNSITTNCTTTVVKMIRAAGGKLAFDWRLIVNGYLPGYLYDRGLVNTQISQSELTALAHIDTRARAEGDSADFSRLIRVGLPSPRETNTP